MSQNPTKPHNHVCNADIVLKNLNCRLSGNRSTHKTCKKT